MNYSIERLESIYIYDLVSFNKSASAKNRFNKFLIIKKQIKLTDRATY